MEITTALRTVWSAMAIAFATLCTAQDIPPTEPKPRQALNADAGIKLGLSYNNNVWSKTLHG